MNPLTRNLLLRNSNAALPLAQLFPPQHQQSRGIIVKVFDGNVEGALQQLTRRMRDSGMESFIKKKAYFDRWMCDHHVKDSTRKYVNRRKIEYRIRNQELFKTLRTLLAKKMSGH